MHDFLVHGSYQRHVKPKARVADAEPAAGATARISNGAARQEGADELTTIAMSSADAAAQLPQPMPAPQTSLLSQGTMSELPHLVIFSGGTAFNSIAGYLRPVFPVGAYRVLFLLPPFHMAYPVAHTMQGASLGTVARKINPCILKCVDSKWWCLHVVSHMLPRPDKGGSAAEIARRRGMPHPLPLLAPCLRPQ